MADVAVDLRGVRLEMDGNLRVARGAADGFGQKRLHVLTVERVMELPGRAAKLRILFHQMHRKALVGQGQGGGHAGDAAADHQRGIVDRHQFLLQAA